MDMSLKEIKDEIDAKKNRLEELKARRAARASASTARRPDPAEGPGPAGEAPEIKIEVAASPAATEKQTSAAESDMLLGAQDVDFKVNIEPDDSKKEESKKEESQHVKAGDSVGETPSGAVDAAPKFRFFYLLREVLANTTKLKGYGLFLAKFLFLESIRMLGTFSLVIYAYAVQDRLVFTDGDGVSGLSTTDYAIFVGIGVLTIFSRLIPIVNLMLVDKLKMQLQVSQATSLMAKVFAMEHNAMIGTPTGEFAQLISKVYLNIDKLVPAFYGSICPMVVETLIAIVFFGVAFGWIVVVQLFMFLVYNFASYRAAEKAAERNKQMMMVMFSEWSKLLDTAGSYERAHFFDNVDFEVDKTRKAFNYMGARMVAVTTGAHVSKAVLTSISLIITGGFVALLSLVVDGLTGFEMGALVLYYFMFVSRLDEYALAVTELRTGLLEYQVLNQFISKRSGIVDVPGAVELDRNEKNPTIEFKNVSFSYNQKVILDDVSFRVEGGQTLGLVGSSGCGKSTILRLLLRFYRQSSGTILINGHDITQVTGRSLRQLFSVVTQDSQLFNASIRDNIAYGKLGSSDDEVVHAAKLAELTLSEESDDQNDLTLDKVIGEKGAKLSGGQQQRVAIARAMLKNGPIYLLDEPTTGLDSLVAKQLQATLDGLCTHSTTITITHHLDDLKKASQILYLQDGKIIERGTYANLLEKRGVFYSQVQARVENAE